MWFGLLWVCDADVLKCPHHDVVTTHGARRGPRWRRIGLTVSPSFAMNFAMRVLLLERFQLIL